MSHEFEEYNEYTSPSGKVIARAFMKINPTKNGNEKKLDEMLALFEKNYEVSVLKNSFGLDKLILQDKKSFAMAYIKHLSSGWFFEFYGKKSEKQLYENFEEVINLIKQNNFTHQYAIKPKIEPKKYVANNEVNELSGVNPAFLI